MIKRVVPSLGLCLAAACLTAVAADDVALTGDSSLQLATVEQGADLLGRQDRFLNALSLFDRQARLQTDRPVANADVGKFSATQVIAWTAEEQARLRDAIEAVAARMKPFDLPFPAKVILVKTTGKEEGNAAYCRGNVIVLPERMTKNRPAALERLLIHELFHVLSSHNAELRRKLYAIIGFTTCAPIQMPQALQDRKLTNPDAPQLDAYIKLTVDGEPVAAVPILFAKTESYDVKRGGTFFDYLEFRLMVIGPTGEGWLPVLRDGQPRLLDPDSTASYAEQIGKNTDYTIHPDEILAENFVHLVNQTKELPTPRIVDSMRTMLAR